MTSGGWCERRGECDRGSKSVHRMIVFALAVLIVYMIAGTVNGILTLAEVKRFHDSYLANQQRPAGVIRPRAGDQSTLVALRWVNR